MNKVWEYIEKVQIKLANARLAPVINFIAVCVMFRRKAVNVNTWFSDFFVDSN